MTKNTVWNALAVIVSVVAAALYFAYAQVVFEWLSVPFDGIVAVLFFFITAGMVGSFVFRGSPEKRAGLVLLAGTLYGVLGEITSPDPRHGGAQVFAAVAFSILAALTSAAASVVRSMSREDRDQGHA